jgi:hypothetical protein
LRPGAESCGQTGIVEPGGQLIEVIRPPLRWEWRVKGLFWFVGSCLFVAWAIRQRDAGGVTLGLLAATAGLLTLVVASVARVEVWSTGLRRRHVLRWRFWVWPDLQGAYPAVGLNRFDHTSAPRLLLANGRLIQLDEFREPWRIAGPRPLTPVETRTLVEAVNLRTGPPPPDPALAAATPRPGRSFAPMILIALLTAIVALGLLVATIVALSSREVGVNPRTLPPGHLYKIWVNPAGQQSDTISCPAPITGWNSHDARCRQEGRGAMVAVALLTLGCIVVLGLEGAYLVRRRRRRRSAEADAALDSTDRAGRPVA